MTHAPSSDPPPGADAGGGMDRRTALRRVAVGSAIAWATPAVTSMPFAAASASGCVPQVLDWDQLPNGTFTSATLAGVTVTLSTTFSGTSALSRNRQVQPGPHGGFPGKSVMFEQLPSTTANGQTITLTFSQAVTNVSFTLTDIDNSANSWSDRVTTITVPTSYTRGSSIIGVGAAGNGTGGATSDGNGGNNVATGAFRNSNSDNNLPDTSAAGNLILNYAGPITDISFRYWCGGVGGGQNQRINLSNIGFLPC